MTDASSRTGGPGWYADPSGAPQSRWWDGTRWTESTAPLGLPHVASTSTTPEPLGPVPHPAPRAEPVDDPGRPRRPPFRLWLLLGVGGLTLVALGLFMASGGDGQGDGGRESATGRSASTSRPTTPDPLPSTTAVTAATTTVPIAPPDDGPDLGSRENMAAPGDVIRIFDTAEGNFDVTLQQFVPDATAVVAATDPQNPPAPPGTRYALLTLGATYHAGQEKRTGSVFSHLDVALFGASGQPIEDGGCAVELPHELDQSAELTDQVNTSGNLCFVLPDAEATGALAGRIEEAFCSANCDAAWFRLR